MILSGITAMMALIASAVAIALPAEHIEVPPPNPAPIVTSNLFDFSVTHFEAQAVALSDQSYVNFHLTPYPTATPAHCFALSTTTNHSLTSIPQTWCHHGPDFIDDDPQDWTHDHVWFSWTMGGDVDPADPTTRGRGGIDQQQQQTTGGGGGGAYLRVVRQVDARTYDESVAYFEEGVLEVVGEGMFVRQVYTGREEFTMPALRFEGVGH
ncbi:uncharacterized protein B0H64DRAFT_437928 [Chaetomium fimeti]|uniref:Uncharacterized protein n=1 Tax=Chaetomium fimeti TaxID=1854472 RepID=A0AAE0HQP0_9PEZI|nr:hypothetical protein B0H64DRAFT_437928 [Chaetomium fimeti]